MIDPASLNTFGLHQVTRRKITLNELLAGQQVLARDHDLGELFEKVTGFRKLPKALNASRDFVEIRDQSLQYEGKISGIDVPTFLSFKGRPPLPKRDRVLMLIGCEPLRSTKDFRERGAFDNSTLVGMPFAAQSEYYFADSQRTGDYFALFDKIFQNWDYIYLTDIFKLYVMGLRLSPNHSYLASSFLATEVELVAPQAVRFLGLTKGRVAVKYFRDNKIHPNVLAVNHPSPVNRFWNLHCNGLNSALRTDCKVNILSKELDLP